MHETDSKLSDAEARLRELEASLRKAEGLAGTLRTQAEESQQREATAKVPWAMKPARQPLLQTKPA